MRKEVDISLKQSNGIVHIIFPTQHDMCSSMVRIQEYYESPYDNIYRMHFSLEEFIDIYAKEKGAFTYFTDWGGFNVNGEILNEFFIKYGDKKDIRTKEKVIRKLVEVGIHDSIGHTDAPDDFYVIVTCEECGESLKLKHEYAHAMYYLYPEYISNIDDLLSKLPNAYLKRLSTKLERIGYRKSFFLDEIQAYLTTSNPINMASLFGGSPDKLHIDYCRKFSEIYNKYRKVYGV